MDVRDFTTIYRRLHLVGAVASAAGAIDLFAFTLLLLPVGSRSLDLRGLIVGNALLFVVYMTFTIATSRHVLGRWTSDMQPWVTGERLPTPEERDHALRQPLLHARLAAIFWMGAAILFTALNAFIVPSAAAGVAVVILLGGLTTTTVDYLLAERILRPVTVRALKAGLPERPVGPGVGGRVTIVWLGATGVPLLGIAATAVAGMVRDDFHRGLFAAAVLFLAGLGASVGLYATVVSTRAVSEPLAGVREALARVERGDFDAEVPVDDASELGLVEAGVNRMTAGLRERERMRDLFGRHVGREVAVAALDGGRVALGGETRCVGVMFADLVGSTRLAQQLAPERVVSLLNDFFALVVAVTESHGGLVNKFEGDGALCVFGAPAALDDPATPALAAARELRARLLDELPQVDAGIAVSAGDAVAGNVGAEERFEYTVIGDPVNEAARLSDLAKSTPERLLASGEAVLRASPTEAARWELGEPTVLRGRTHPTRVATLSSGRGGVRSKIPLAGG